MFYANHFSISKVRARLDYLPVKGRYDRVVGAGLYVYARMCPAPSVSVRTDYVGTRQRIGLSA
jgi:hypothetical protein